MCVFGGGGGGGQGQCRKQDTKTPERVLVQTMVGQALRQAHHNGDDPSSSSLLSSLPLLSRLFLPHRRAEGEVWHEVAVHDIEVNVVRPLPLHVERLFHQP